MIFLCTCVLSLQQKVASQVHMNSSANIVQQKNKLITWLLLEKDQLMLKLESARNGQSWDDIENADIDQVREITSLLTPLHNSAHIVISAYLNFLFCYFWFWAGCRPYEELYIEDSAVGG